MKLPTEKRNKLFHLGRFVNERLGNLFQNEMDITPEFVDTEINEARHLKGILEGYLKQLEGLKAEAENA